MLDISLAELLIITRTCGESNFGIHPAVCIAFSILIQKFLYFFDLFIIGIEKV